MSVVMENNQEDLSIDAERLVARSLWENRVGDDCRRYRSIFNLAWHMVYGSSGILPLWAGFILSTISTAFAYLPSHAGQHGHLSGKHKNLKWLNAFVGQISLIPLAQSHHILKAIHMKHHAHTNNPEKI